MPWLLAIVTTSTPAARSAANALELVRAQGCRVSRDRGRVQLFVQTAQAQTLFDDLRRNGRLAVVFTSPSTHRSLQLKGDDAVIARARPADLARVAAYRAAMVAELGGIGISEALARALLAGAPDQPGLLVLDDPFSAVDVDTEVRLVEGLMASVGPAAPREERTTIVLCSHRLAAFTRVDLVVLLENGQVAEVGSHAELLAKPGRYAQIYLAQQRIGQAGRLSTGSLR